MMKKKVVCIVLQALFVAIVSVAVNAQTDNKQDNPYKDGIPIMRFSNPERMFEILPGRWSFGENTCENPYVISVSDDRKQIILKITGEDETDSSKSIYIYDVLEVSDVRIKTRIVDEDRKTESGNTAEWYFYFSTPDRFMWQLTEWKSNAFTPPVDRCKESSIEGNVG